MDDQKFFILPSVPQKPIPPQIFPKTMTITYTVVQLKT